jgi:hypothetical protein
MRRRYRLQLSLKKQALRNKNSLPEPIQQKPSKHSGAAISTKKGWRELFAIDARSLALFRIAIGALLLIDVAIRAGDVNAMYTDEGMFPRGEIRRLATSIWNWSFHFASGATGYQATLLGIAACLALALLLGVGTRVVAIGSWLLLVSIHHRVPPILSGAEILLRMLLFWGMFLPLGVQWSLDSWWKKRRGKAVPQESEVQSVATVAILLQMGVMYLLSAIFKFNAQWFGGEAVGGVLAHDFYASEFGPALLQFPGLLKGLTWATFAMELAAAFVLFWPGRTATVRLVGIAMLAAMHLGIGFFLEVGLFSYVALAGLTVFLRKEFWNSRWLARFARGHEASPQAPKPAMAKERPVLARAAQGACMALLVYVLAVNINTLPGQPLAPIGPEKWKPLATGLGLRQRWGMFEAIPTRDGWYVARAKLQDGSEVDLLRNGAALDWDRPKFPAGIYPNHYWQKLFREMAYTDEQGFQLLRAPVAKYLCREWNGRNGPEKHVVEFEMVYCYGADSMDLKGQIEGPYRERLLHLGPGQL